MTCFKTWHFNEKCDMKIMSNYARYSQDGEKFMNVDSLFSINMGDAHTQLTRDNLYPSDFGGVTQPYFS